MLPKKKKKKGTFLIDALVALSLFMSFNTVFFSVVALKTSTLEDTQMRLLAQNELVNQLEKVKMEKFRPLVFPYVRKFKLKNERIQGEVKFSLFQKGILEVLVLISWKNHQGHLRKEWICTYIDNVN